MSVTPRRASAAYARALVVSGALAVCVGCAGGPPSAACPEGTWIETHLDEGFPKTAACVRHRRGGGTEVYGWQLSYHDRGEPFFGLEQVDPGRVMVMCVTDAGAASLERHQVGKLQRSLDPTIVCVDKPIGPLWKKLAGLLADAESSKRSE